MTQTDRHAVRTKTGRENIRCFACYNDANIYKLRIVPSPIVLIGRGQLHLLPPSPWLYSTRYECIVYTLSTEKGRKLFLNQFALGLLVEPQLV